MGITRSARHKRTKTGGKRSIIRKKRKFELGRQPANTRLGPRRVHFIRTLGGNSKARALRLDAGNFSWGSEHVTRKTRIIGVVYSAPNNEYIRTNTLVKSVIVQIDSSPFRQWYEAHYGKPITEKRAARAAKAAAAAKATAAVPEEVSPRLAEKFAEREALSKIDPLLEAQFNAGRLYAAISSRPGQCGRADGYIVEGKELEFYLRKLKAKKH
ncbi:40S ribosomal protein S8 [Cantharellus anzutake]|uniref:40S ribosomal protein S8 n=1 Tax=Cantharellus anzutake TaxID=1750568 RepID=UPI00190461A9|nr:40S ribosomal protein S8 [Cantharellus anzutake]XP_038922773.1 40S ribosomal protein S8 [Cantharellus anzutake]KAF8319589.1 40S ribosomal protein S8 [Cantharellus anzutake]KAF8342134.1 40S ribosomal protein S8 [Cantharellus anzutake]